VPADRLGRWRASAAGVQLTAPSHLVEHPRRRLPTSRRGRHAAVRDNVAVTSGFDARSFLAEAGRPAQVAAVSSSRVPLLASLWFVFDSGRFWFNSLSGSPIPTAAARAAEVAVIVDDFSPPHSIRQIRVRGPAQIEDHDVERVHRIYARYLGADRRVWPDFFQRRLDNSKWVLWSVWPDTGLAVSTPNFRGDEYRWRTRADSPL
jgi:hypothetical protein